MSQSDPLILHAIVPSDVPEGRRRALEGLREGRRVNVFAREGGSPILLFSVRPIGNRTFVYSARGAALLENQAGAIAAGFAWMPNHAA